MTLPDRIKAWRNDPSLFVRQVLKGPERWERQFEILASVRDNPETYVKSGHGIGKTYVAADAVLWFLFCHRPAKVITTAPTWRQVEDLLWSEIRKKHSAVDWLGGSLLQTRLTISDEHFAVGLSPKVELSETDQGVRLQGYHSPHILVLFDEAPGVNQKLWQMKESLMSSAHARFLGIGNPTASSGEFYEAFRRNRGKCITMSLFDSPNFKAAEVRSLADLKALVGKPANEIEALPIPVPALATVAWALRMLDKWGEESPIFQSRVMAEFPEQAEDCLISMKWLERCLAPGVGGSGNKRVLGVDVARFGEDMTVLLGMKGWRMEWAEKHGGWSTDQTAGRILQVVQERNYECIAIDDEGIGGGVTDQVLQRLDKLAPRCAIIPFRGSNTPTIQSDESTYLNRRAQAYWEAREAIRNTRVGIQNWDDLFSQLTSIRWRVSPNGKIRIESKDEMRQRGFSSPDEADALILALWAAKAVNEGQAKRLAERITEGPTRESALAPWEQNEDGI